MLSFIVDPLIVIQDAVIDHETKEVSAGYVSPLEVFQSANAIEIMMLINIDNVDFLGSPRSQ